MADAKKLIPWIKKWEGGFVNDPIDRGGATNKGITISTFRFYYGAAMTVEDLRNMSDSQWQQIFELGYHGRQIVFIVSHWQIYVLTGVGRLGQRLQFVRSKCLLAWM